MAGGGDDCAPCSSMPISPNSPLHTLLAAGADPNILDSAGRTPIHTAVCVLPDTEHHVLVMMQALIDAGANVLICSISGHTPLDQLHSMYFDKTLDSFHGVISYAIAILVRAGERNWNAVPVPCYGLERAWWRCGGMHQRTLGTCFIGWI